MSNEFNPAVIPLYLEADSKELLIEMMYLNNTINGRAFNYMPPIKEGKRWVVWFYADVNTYRRVEAE
jgi:hypothetical protein